MYCNVDIFEVLLDIFVLFVDIFELLLDMFVIFVVIAVSIDLRNFVYSISLTI
jgi:hypothetical protein